MVYLILIESSASTSPIRNERLLFISQISKSLDMFVTIRSYNHSSSNYFFTYCECNPKACISDQPARILILKENGRPSYCYVPVTLLSLSLTDLQEVLPLI